jgi:hypothetical protein
LASQITAGFSPHWFAHIGIENIVRGWLSDTASFVKRANGFVEIVASLEENGRGGEI